MLCSFVRLDSRPSCGESARIRRLWVAVHVASTVVIAGEGATYGKLLDWVVFDVELIYLNAVAQRLRNTRQAVVPETCQQRYFSTMIQEEYFCPVFDGIASDSSWIESDKRCGALQLNILPQCVMPLLLRNRQQQSLNHGIALDFSNKLFHKFDGWHFQRTLLF